MTIGARIVYLRKDRGLTLKELAAWSGCQLSHISDIEHERSHPSLVTCQRLANAFNMPLSVFFDGVEIGEAL